MPLILINSNSLIIVLKGFKTISTRITQSSVLYTLPPPHNPSMILREKSIYQTLTLKLSVLNTLEIFEFCKKKV